MTSTTVPFLQALHDSPPFEADAIPLVPPISFALVAPGIYRPHPYQMMLVQFCADAGIAQVAGIRTSRTSPFSTHYISDPSCP